MSIVTGLPNIRGPLEEVESGGLDIDWMPVEHTRFCTNAFVFTDKKILLGHKKRGFGQQYVNGFGGKVDPNESSAEAAVRELKEEAGIDAELHHAGVLFFVNQGSQWAFHIDIYSASEWTGDPVETEEMSPEWFSVPSPPGQDIPHSLPSIPFHKMWASDQLWLPLLISGQYFEGRTDFCQDPLQPDKHILQKWWFGVKR